MAGGVAKVSRIALDAIAYWYYGVGRGRKPFARLDADLLVLWRTACGETARRALDARYWFYGEGEAKLFRVLDARFYWHYGGRRWRNSSRRMFLTPDVIGTMAGRGKLFAAVLTLRLWHYDGGGRRNYRRSFLTLGFWHYGGARK